MIEKGINMSMHERHALGVMLSFRNISSWGIEL